MDQTPNSAALDRVIVDGLEAWGLSPTIDGRRVQTGLPGLSFDRTEAQAVALEGRRTFAHTELVINLDHPEYGRHTIGELVSLDGETPQSALEACLSLFLTMTLDPLRSLFDEDRLARPQVRLTTLTEGQPATAWKLYSGVLDVRGPDAGAFDGVFEGTFPVGLVPQSLFRRLRRPGLHWCKISGEQHGATSRFGCVMDGVQATDAEQEMRDCLELPPTANWSFRAFAVVVPRGEPEPAEVAEIERTFAADRTPPRRRWWPFGSGPRYGWYWVTLDQPEPDTPAT